MTEFVEKANLVHKNKFDYSRSVYINASTPVIIICPEHGEFLQKPEAHLKGRGCFKCHVCSLNKTQEEFIVELKEKYGDKYDYSKVVYKGCFEKITLICPVHGPFKRQANDILIQKLEGCCPKCNKHNKVNKFIETGKNKLLIILSQKFNCPVSKIDFIDKLHIQMYCEKHGYYVKRKTALLQGYGCETCQEEKLNLENGKTFFRKAKEIHNNFYIYDENIYKGSFVKIPIICPKHGEFYQLPNMHIQKQGCPLCSTSKGELLVKRFLEENKIKFEQQKTFDEYKYKRKLKFDFYLPEYNICIEYDGELHFFSNFKGVKTNLEYTQARDKIKNEYCKRSNIQLIRIKYTENIINKLKFLKK